MTTARKRARTAPPRASGVQLGHDVARQQILIGAGRIFALHGFRDPSVDDLLAAAAVSRRTFYRFFTSKEDVAVALYDLGTTLLVESCVRAAHREPDPVKQLEHYIEFHLVSARTMGRLVYVLGGEAQRPESKLHPRRLWVHDQLVDALRLATPSNATVDPLVFRTLILTFEAATRTMIEACDHGRGVTLDAIARARAVMMRIGSATMAGHGDGVTPIPRCASIVDPASPPNARR